MIELEPDLNIAEVARSLHAAAGDRQELARLRTAIEETLQDNAHLADGDNCTLIKLKRAISPNAEALPQGRKETHDSQLRRKMNKQWRKVAQERINAELEGRSIDERCAREEMTWMRGYFNALKDVLANNQAEPIKKL